LLSGGFYDAWLSDLSEVAKVTKKGAAIRSQFESLPALRQDVDILKKNSNQIIRGYAIAANKADILYFIAVTGSPDRIAEIEKSLATFSIP
jgi:hypothetical protein